MREGFLAVHVWFLFILQTTLFYLLPVTASAQKTKVEYGPFEPYGGKREVTYSKDSVPVELKEFDILGNLRKHVIVKGDTQNRLTLRQERIYNEKKQLVGGLIKTISYKDSLDYGGKTFYKQFDPASNTFLVVKPLISIYDQAMVTAPPDSLQLNPFYKKYTDAFGIPIVSSNKTHNAALLVA